MATYRQIKGVTIQTQDTDPILNVGAWASGGSLNTAGDFRGTAGIQTAAITVGGQPQVANVERYDGTSWSEVGDLGAGRYMVAVAGTYTAAIGAGGYTPGGGSGGRNLVELWNGTGWSETTELGSATYGAVASGTSTSAIVYGGSNPAIALNQTWNGSAWGEEADQTHPTCLLYTSDAADE